MAKRKSAVESAMKYAASPYMALSTMGRELAKGAPLFPQRANRSATSGTVSGAVRAGKRAQTSATVSSAMNAKAPEKRLMDKYGRTISSTEAKKRADYRQKLKSAGSEAAANAMREAEMKRRSQYRKTTLLAGAKGPGKAQAQMESRRMAAQGPKARKGATASEAMRMRKAAASKATKSRRGL